MGVLQRVHAQDAPHISSRHASVKCSGGPPYTHSGRKRLSCQHAKALQAPVGCCELKVSNPLNELCLVKT